MNTTFVNKDNLEYIKTLDDDSVDLIYFDPPFTITEAKYDKALDWTNLWSEMWRVLKENRAVVIHCSQPFTFDLVASQRKYFKYNWYWDKISSPTGFFFSKKQPLRILEEVCVFYKSSCLYNPQMTLKEKPVKCKKRKQNLTNYFPRAKSVDEKIYTHSYPTHIIRMKRVKHKYSTRPVALCEYFIKTYSNEGDTVLDLTCSNGQSAIACKNIQRNYIGVDIDENMINDAISNFEKTFGEDIQPSPIIIKEE